jgi:Tfp pilus assembly protein PilV
MPADGRPVGRARRGFVIGELLIALLLLAVAVSSLAALMYSVSRRPATRADAECVASAAAVGKCVPAKPGSAPSKLLRSECESRSVFDRGACKDSIAARDSSGDVVVKSRTDSAAMALMAKKEKAQRPQRPDLGFVR